MFAPEGESPVSADRIHQPCVALVFAEAANSKLVGGRAGMCRFRLPMT